MIINIKTLQKKVDTNIKKMKIFYDKINNLSKMPEIQIFEEDFRLFFSKQLPINFLKFVHDNNNFKDEINFILTFLIIIKPN